MARLRVFTVSILSILLFTVMIQNMDSVETRFLFWKLALPRALLLLLSILVGFVLGVLTSLALSATKRRTNGPT